jgi:hypothetical protein
MGMAARTGRTLDRTPGTTTTTMDRTAGPMLTMVGLSWLETYNGFLYILNDIQGCKLHSQKAESLSKKLSVCLEEGRLCSEKDGLPVCRVNDVILVQWRVGNEGLFRPIKFAFMVTSCYCQAASRGTLC